MKTVHVHYYAILREWVGRETETRETEAPDAKTFFEELGRKHQWSFNAKRFKVAINEEFLPWETSLNDGDHVALIPPVAGGAPCSS
jgi:molybdopterin synthase sulfur carrier subunit